MSIETCSKIRRFSTRVRYKCKVHRYFAFRAAGFFSIFFFWRKTGRVIDWIKSFSEWEGNGSARIHTNSYTYTWKWEERDGNSSGGKVQEIVLFRCHFHGNWVPREGPPGSPVAFRCLDLRHAMEHGKKGERERIIRIQWREKEQINESIGSLFWSKLEN